jgi:hypothetical protein
LLVKIVTTAGSGANTTTANNTSGEKQDRKSLSDVPVIGELFK